MSQMSVKKITETEIKSLGILTWPTWSKEPSTFPWSYSDKETAYIIEGEVTVTSEDGESISFGPGDLVIFNAGLSCTWHVKTPLLKHYRFG
jgi:uncharacterized cupin superfamily protein